MDVQISPRDVGGDHVADRNRQLLKQVMSYSLGFSSTTPLHQHGKKPYDMVSDEGVIEFFVPSGRLRVVDDRHLHSAISQIKEENPDPNGPHVCSQHRITV